MQNKLKIFGIVLLSGLITFPLMSQAVLTIRTLIDNVTNLLSSSVVPLLFVAALAIFIFGVVNYLINANKPDKRKEGTKYMIWGVIALFVMVSIWGIIAILRNSIGFDTSSNLPKPEELIK